MRKRYFPLFFLFLGSLCQTIAVAQVEPASAVDSQQVREEYRPGQDRPDNIVFHSVLYYFNNLAERDESSAIRIIMRRFDEPSTEQAIEILRSIRETIAQLENDQANFKKRVLCNNRSLLARDVYLHRLDTLDDSRLTSLQQYYVQFSASLSTNQRDAFERYIESRRKKGHFILLSHRETYKESNRDVYDTIKSICLTYGEPL